MQIWNEIKTDSDVEGFIDKTRALFSYHISSMNYKMYDYENDEVSSLSVILENNHNKIEMLFSHILNFRFGEIRNNTINDTIDSCYLKIHTDMQGKSRQYKIIVWSDRNITPNYHSDAIELGCMNCSAIFAYEMKWRYLDNIEEAEKCLQKE